MPSIREYVVACPQCGAVSPDVAIDDTAGVWRCACGAGGDLFDYLMQDKNVTFQEALRIVGVDAGVDVDIE